MNAFEQKIYKWHSSGHNPFPSSFLCTKLISSLFLFIIPLSHPITIPTHSNRSCNPICKSLVPHFLSLATISHSLREYKLTRKLFPIYFLWQLNCFANHFQSRTFHLCSLSCEHWPTKLLIFSLIFHNEKWNKNLRFW